MAEAAVASSKKSRKKREPVHSGIERQYMLAHPETVKGRDGKTYKLFHRTGASGGAPSKRDLMGKEGFAAEIAAVERDANKRYRSIEDAREVVQSRETRLKQILDARVRSFKVSLQREYAAQGLVPLVAMVRIHSSDDERRLFIQGFTNEKGEFVVGSRDDGALWAIEAMSNTRGMARTHKLAFTIGKDLVTRGISGEIKERLALALKA